MLDPEVLVTDVISDTAMEIISEGLSQFNDEHTGYSDRKPLAVLVRDPCSCFSFLNRYVAAASAR
jgi:hypothetical protein